MKLLIENYNVGRGFIFLLGGCLNTALTYALYLVLKLFFYYQWAYGFAYIMGIIISYVVNSKFVFKVKHSWGTFSLYPFIYLFQYGIGAFLLYFFIDINKINNNIAPLFVIITTIPASYSLNKLILQRVK